MRQTVLHLALTLALILSVHQARADSIWEPIGPPGGDVRDLAQDPRDPNVVLLGTSTGVLYRSADAGLHWQRLTPGFPEAGMSLDDILFTPDGALLVGFWQVGGSGGGVARSDDGGRSFTLLPGIAGQSVRGLAFAKSDARILTAVAISGVFRSDDAGESWRRISPEGHPGLRNLGSVAVDPTDPDTIYVGTWHLPWKTTDGGNTWRLIQPGMIVDSDVMTLTIDRRAPAGVFATACSGIYRSSNGAALWSKVRGIPGSARRTRAFLQHPRRADVFFAGTTEGLWLSEDDTRTWRRLTESAVVVNAVEVLADDTILIGSDGLGVLRSHDGGATWTVNNDGFFERPVLCARFDAGTRRLLVGVSGGGVLGGVWSASWPEGGWSRQGAGLEGREVLNLSQGPGGLLAATDDGAFRYDPRRNVWTRLGTTLGGVDLHPRVADAVTLSGDVVILATSGGLLHSTDVGTTWTRQALGNSQAVLALASSPQTEAVYAATPLAFFESRDAGATWTAVASTPPDAFVRRLLVSPADDRTLVAATTRGLIKSSDGGRTWRIRGGGLPHADIPTLAADATGRILYAGDHTYGGVYRSSDAGESWERLPTAGLHSQAILATALDPVTGSLIASGATGGVFRLTTAETAGTVAPAAQ